MGSKADLRSNGGTPGIAKLRLRALGYSMAQPRLTFDNTELVLIDIEAKTPTVHNLSCDDLVRFRLTQKRTFALYRFVEEAVLELYVRGTIKPLLVRQRHNRGMFESYVTNTRKFCKANQIPFVDENRNDEQTRNHREMTKGADHESESQ